MHSSQPSTRRKERKKLQFKKIVSLSVKNVHNETRSTLHIFNRRSNETPHDLDQKSITIKVSGKKD